MPTDPPWNLLASDANFSPRSRSMVNSLPLIQSF